MDWLIQIIYQSWLKISFFGQWCYGVSFSSNQWLNRESQRRISMVCRVVIISLISNPSEIANTSLTSNIVPTTWYNPSLGWTRAHISCRKGIISAFQIQAFASGEDNPRTAFPLSGCDEGAALTSSYHLVLLLLFFYYFSKQIIRYGVMKKGDDVFCLLFIVFCYAYQVHVLYWPSVVHFSSNK